MRARPPIPAWALFVALLLGSASVARPASGQDGVSADDVVGVWVTEEENGEWSRVRVERCGDRFCGRIVWLSHPTVPEDSGDEFAGKPKLDIHNPDEDRRSEPILGLEIMHSFRFDDGEWKDGRIYDPQVGKTYRCELRLEDEGRILKVRGFIKIAFAKVGRTTEWTRFDGEASTGASR